MTNRPGVCRFCGCSDFSPCPYGCAWANPVHTVCSSCAPAAKAEARALQTLARAGYRPLEFVAAFHLGFIVGWFTISARSPYGRNPYPARTRRVTRRNWDRGQRAGAEASRAYQRVCGPLLHTVRRAVLQGSR